MFARLAILALLLCLGTARAGERDAVAGHAADAATTAFGLAMGAAEANPLGIATLVVKVATHRHINQQPAIAQPRLWSMYGAMGWGATANNLCVIAAIATGGAAGVLCPVFGFAVGAGFFQADEEAARRETFDAVCADARAANPDLVCIDAARSAP